MASVKVKFRPSTVNGKEGTIYYQVIHKRVIRQINTDYKLFVSEWDSHSETVILHRILSEERNNYLLSISSRIRWDKDRLNKIIHALSQSGIFVTDDIVMRFHDNRQELSFNAYIRQQIARLKRLGKIRTSETYTAALRSFSSFMNDKEILFDQLNADLLSEYEACLKGRGNTPNTISFYMRILKAVYNRAVEDGLTGQQLFIRWERCMQEILDKYPVNGTEHLLPIITEPEEDYRKQYANELHRVNHLLKKIGKQLDLPIPLTLYVGRHSWANIAKSRNVPISVISEGMGHDSENTTQIYLASLDTSVVDRANKKILDLL